MIFWSYKWKNYIEVKIIELDFKLEKLKEAQVGKIFEKIIL